MSFSIDNTWRQTGNAQFPRFVNYVTVPAGQTVARTYVWDYSSLHAEMPETGEAIQISLSMALETAGEQTWYFQNLRFIDPLVPLTPGVARLNYESGTIAGSPAMQVVNGGEFTLPNGTRGVVQVSSLLVDTSPDQPAGGGRIDLGTSRIDIGPAAESPGPSLREAIIAGRNGGAWDGAAGITSQSAPSFDGASGFAVGYRVAGDNSASVAWASLGDADLDGAVTTADVNAILTSGLLNTGIPGAVWQQGDFDYDGLVTTADINALLTTGRLNSGSYLPSSTAGVGAATVTSVPEPSSVLLAAVGAGLAALVGRRRNQRRLIAG
jgi:hypothetical protein